MKRLFASAVAASFLVIAPPVYEPVQAQTLFEKLFPKTAERRRKRLAAERARRQAERRRALRRVKVPKVEKPKYYTYKPRGVVKVNFAKLDGAFKKHASLATVAFDQARSRRADTLINEYGLSFESVADIMGELKQPLGLASLQGDWQSLSMTARGDISKAVLAHYGSAPEFIWMDAEGRPTDAARAVLNVLNDADAYGLNATDYDDKAFSSWALDPRAFEFALTLKALRYASDAKHGRVDANRISAYHDFSRNKINATSLLAGLVKSEDPADFLMKSHPQDQAFDHLVKELAALSAVADTEQPIVIKRGTFLKPGSNSAELPKIVEIIRRRGSEELKEQHADLLAGYQDGETYTPELVVLIKDMQRELKLKPDGIVGKNTIRRLNPVKVTGDVKKQRVILAMERLRWHPDQLGARHVFINQPAYRVQLMNRGRVQIAMNTVVGKKANQTNFFHDEIEYVEFNPYWGVPRSILVNEMLPKLRANPGYLDNLGYEITDRRGRNLSSYSVDWYSVGANFPFDVRQPPGPKNALGSLKIMFPNRHSIYMHDTPAKSLFSRSTRAYSHGCVRLERPHEMAAAVLGTTVEDIRSQISDGQNKQRRLKSKLPVYVSYFTAWPDSSGKMRYYADIYGRDKALQKALNAELATRASKREA